jgi:diacylglycerol kinase family enzyme
MHIYIYDHFLSQKKYEKILARIETKITDLGLNGRIIRLGITNSVFDAVENEVRKGAKTIVAVGNDHILSQVLNSMAILESQHILNRDLPLGFIPIGNKNNDMPEYLGIGYEENACNILSARRIQKLDLGLANNNFFLSNASISSKNTIISIDDEYSIETSAEGKIMIINLPIKTELPDNFKSSAIDGVLELYISNKQSKVINFSNKPKLSQSVFKFKKLVLINKNEPVLIDDSIKIPSPVEISIAKEKINIIVGKDRKF